MVKWFRSEPQQERSLSSDETSQAESAAQSAPVPSATARYFMPFKAVRIEALDQNGDVVIVPAKKGRGGGPLAASGFLMRVDSGLYLYTCWHVVTGTTLSNPVVPGTMTRRMKLRVSMRASEHRGGVTFAVDGLLKFDVDLFDTSTDPATPLWEQYELSAQNEKLSRINLKQPLWHDAVRVRVPESLQPSGLQVLTPNDLWRGFLAPGDRLLLVGYPYGYSAPGTGPTPIVMTRFTASIPQDAREEVFIDGGGAEGMSGGPVFCDTSEGLFLFGMYTGVIFPAAAEGVEFPDRTTALGTVCPLRFLFSHYKAAWPGDMGSP